MQRCYGRHNVSRKSILLHGVILLPDATSYDNKQFGIWNNMKWKSILKMATLAAIFLMIRQHLNKSAPPKSPDAPHQISVLYDRRLSQDCTCNPVFKKAAMAFT